MDLNTTTPEQHMQLAQLNIARMLAPLEDPIMADFVTNLERINQLAEQFPGYVWRLETPEGDATAIRTFGEDYLVNLSVWENIDSLFEFVYRSNHASIMSRRKQWFERLRDAYTVLWWIPTGHLPTPEEAKVKLDQLRTRGPTPDSFTFKQPFPPPGEMATGPLESYDDSCPTT